MLRILTLDRQKIISILLGISVFLLVGNIIISKISPAKASTGGNVSVKTLNDEFEKTLLEFDLKPEWFKRIPVKKSQDSISYKYRIRVPKDLPVPVILNELNSKLLNQPLRFSSREMKAHKESSIRIFFENAVLLESDFIMDTSISRNKPVYGFMINDIENMSDNELTELLSYPEKFALLLTPSQRSESLKKQIVESGREFAIVLHDDIPEVKYRLDENYSKGRLNGSVGNIIKSFSEAKLFLLDEFSNKELAIQVENMFIRRKIKYVPLSRYSQISEKDYISLPDDLHSHIKRSQGSDIFLITSKDFMQLYGEFKNLRKRGYKFIIPSAINYCI